VMTIALTRRVSTFCIGMSLSIFVLKPANNYNINVDYIEVIKSNFSLSNPLGITSILLRPK
jgi:hypothetical protein